MAWTKDVDGSGFPIWYGTDANAGQVSRTDPTLAPNPLLNPSWNGWKVISGDPSGTGVSQTAAINPATGKAETIVEVAGPPDANGIRQSMGSMPYSEYLAAKAKDPSIGFARSTPSPENSMLKTSTAQDIGDAIANVAPAALAFAAPGLSGLLQGATGLSPTIANALTSAGSSVLTGGNPITGALSSLASGGLNGVLGGVDANAYDAMQFGTPAGGLVGTGLNTISPLQLAGGTYGGNTTQIDVTPQVDAVNVTPDWQDYAASKDQAQFGTGYNGNDAVPITTNLPGVVTGTNVPNPAVSNSSTGFPMPPAPVLGGAAAGLAMAGLGGDTGTADSGQYGTGATGVGNATGTSVSGTTPIGAAQGSAIAKILAGTATGEDWAKLAGQALPGLVSAFGSSQQASNQKALTDQLLAYGAPSRARYETSMTPGFDPNSIPGYSAAVNNASDAVLRSLSTQGNPFGNPGGLIEANKKIVAGTALPAIQQYQNQNANTGQIGALTSAAPASAQNALSANNNVWSDLGSAASSALNPQPDLASILKQLAGKSTSAYGLA